MAANYSIYYLDGVHIKVVKGNELADIITESHSPGEFQDQMADGRDIAYIVNS